MSASRPALPFREIQHLTQWWVWLIVLFIGVLGWWAWIQQIWLGVPFGAKPAPDGAIWAVWALAGLFLPLLPIAIHMHTRVDDRGVHVRIFPLLFKTVPFGEIVTCQVRRYRPIHDYMGWGIRWTPWAGWAYNLHGDSGVQLVLRDGRRILVGSQRAVELAAAIRPRLSPGDRAIAPMSRRGS